MRSLPSVLALLLPTLLVGGVFYALGSQPTKDQERQLRNAGMLLNGEVLERPAIDVIAETMQRNPRLVILGNSFANTNVQLQPLLKQLGLGKREGARLSIPNTIGAHWYAMLRHRVFTPGQTPPDVVLIASDLQSVLLTTPLSEGSMGNLVALAGTDDPVLSSKVERVTNWWWSIVLEGRRRWRYHAVNSVKENATRLVHPSVNEKRRRRLTNDAMDQVFHPSKTLPSLSRTQLPIAALGIDLDDLPLPKDSFVEAMAKLCYENGARLVLVRNRESPLIAPGRGDVVPPGTEDAVRALIEPYGGQLLDFRRLPMVAEQFDNIDHMTKDGSKRFTRVLSGALRDLAIPNDPLARPGIPAYNGPTTGPYPDTRKSWINQPATWSFPAWTAPAEGFRIRASLEGPTLLLNGQPLPTTMQHGVSIVDVKRPAPTGAFVLETQGEGLVTALAVGEGAPRMLVGHRSDLDAASLALLATTEVFDGEVYLDGLTPRFDAPPHPVARPARRFKAAPAGTAVYDHLRLAEISDLAVRRFTVRNARCSPLRVFEDGVPLEQANVGCAEVKQLRNGRMCHVDRRLLFSASDTTNPMSNGRSYRLGLDPQRSCDGGMWLYPGDRAHLDVPPERLREMRRGVTQLALNIRFPQPNPHSIIVQLVVDGQARPPVQVQRSGTYSALFPVDRIGPEQQLEVILSHPGKGFVLVNQVQFYR